VVVVFQKTVRNIKGLVEEEEEQEKEIEMEKKQESVLFEIIGQLLLKSVGW